MNNIILSRLFHDCVEAIIKGNIDVARELLFDISTYNLRPQARILYDKLKSRVPNSEAEKQYLKRNLCATQEEIGIILLLTNGNTSALARSLKSIYHLRNKHNKSIHCILLECLPKDTDVYAISDNAISPLPKLVTEAIQAGTLDYVVEYGNSSSAMRRAVRCSSGRYISFVREGDQLSELMIAKSINELPKEHDVIIGSISDSDIYQRKLRRLLNNSTNTYAIPAIISLQIIYDGALLINRDYLDELLGLVDYDAKAHYVGYLNEILTVHLTTYSGNVSFAPQLCCLPDKHNLEIHTNYIHDHSFNIIQSRRKEAKKQLEPRTISLINEILDEANNTIQSNKKTSFPPFCKDNQLESVQQGNISSNVRQYTNTVSSYLYDLLLNESTDNCDTTNWLVPIIDNKSKLPVVSIVSSLFNGEQLIHNYFYNITHQTCFDKSELIVVLPLSNVVQDIICEVFLLSNNNISLIHLEQDPGIYECWNKAIKRARGTFITNANLDDRRDKNHIQQLIDILENNKSDVASSGLGITRDISDILNFNGDIDQWLSVSEQETWYTSNTNDLTNKQLNDFFLFDNNGDVLQCMNFPHCMPVWRRELHRKLGYFNEREFGTYADFAFWLEAISKGSLFSHYNKPLGLYYIDPQSHNRRNKNSKKWDNIILKYLKPGVTIHHPEHVQGYNVNLINNINNDLTIPRLDFGNQLEHNYGNHRSGWSYALSGLSKYHDNNSPVYCDVFIEKKFVWGANYGEGGSERVIPYDMPWIGFIHVPPNVPSWFQSEQSNQRILSRSPWKKSIRMCYGLFTLTEYHRNFLLDILKPNFPISTLYHPTEFPERIFDFQGYLDNPNKKIVQVGWWLRKLHAVNSLNVKNHTATILGKSDWSKSILSYAERRVNNILLPPNGASIDFLSNEDYDELLSKNLVFIDFYDTSANNAVIECIARGTPLLVCKHPAVVEYLGGDYPLYYTDYSKIEKMVNDKNRILEAHKCLLDNQVRDKLSIKYFLESFSKSDVLNNVGNFIRSQS